MADGLGDLGETVHDRTLVLNVLRSLNERWQYLVALIICQRLFPLFADLVTVLRLEEIWAPPQAAASAPMALVVAPPPTGAPRPPAPAQQPRAPAAAFGTTPPTTQGNANNG